MDMYIPEAFEGAGQILPSWLSNDWSKANHWSRGLTDELRWSLGNVERDILPTLNAIDPDKAREVSSLCDELKDAIHGYSPDVQLQDAGKSYARLQELLQSLDREEAREDTPEE